MSMTFPIQKFQTHHTPDFVWCHLSLCLCSKIFSPPCSSSDNTKQQQQLILCLLRLKAINTSLHLFLWTCVTCRRMRCITKMIVYRIRKTLLIPSLSWLWYWRIISQPCCMIAGDRNAVWQQGQRSLTWHIHELYDYLSQQYLILQRDYKRWGRGCCFRPPRYPTIPGTPQNSKQQNSNLVMKEALFILPRKLSNLQTFKLPIAFIEQYLIR